MKFEENLRWWVNWLGQLTHNDPHNTRKPNKVSISSASHDWSKKIKTRKTKCRLWVPWW